MSSPGQQEQDQELSGGRAVGKECVWKSDVKLEKKPVPNRTSSLAELEPNPGVQIPSVPLLPAVTTNSTD